MTKDINAQLTSRQQAMITGHTMMRFLKNFKSHERSKHLEKLMKRLHKMIIGHARKEHQEAIFVSEFEKLLWIEATKKYEEGHPIIGIDFCALVYSYYAAPLKKYGNISEKLIEEVQVHAKSDHIPSDEYIELESNGEDILSVYIKELEPHSGIGLRVSLFAGRRLTLKNNLILEGKKVKDGF